MVGMLRFMIIIMKHFFRAQFTLQTGAQSASQFAHTHTHTHTHTHMHAYTHHIMSDINQLSLPTPLVSLQWGAADAEIKVPSGENTELKRSPFKAWCRSVYSHTCYTYCWGFLPCLFLPFWSIHLNFFPNLSWFFMCWMWLTQGSCVGLQNKIGHAARGRFPCWVPVAYK